NNGSREMAGSLGATIASCAVAVAVAVFACAWLVIRERELLPILLLAGHSTPAMFRVLSSVCLLNLAGLAALWWRRPHSALDVWLMVVLCAWLFDFTLSTVINADRYDLGFYAGRLYGVLASSFVLAMLLIESTRQQMQLSRLLATARAQSASERDKFSERERLFSAAVDSSNDAIMTESLDGVITGWNKAAESLFGYGADEAIGQSIDIIVPDSLRGEVHDLLNQVRDGRVI